jgi:hypothetical protein
LELFGESYDRYFETNQGRIGVMADIYASADVLELRDLLIYPIGVNRLSIGPDEVIWIRTQIEDEIRGMGYQELRITAHRLGGANPGRDVVLRRKL